MHVCARWCPHRRGLNRGIGLPPGTSAGSARPAVSERMGNSLHTIEWWCFRQSGEKLRGREVEVEVKVEDEQYGASGLIYARIP